MPLAGLLIMATIAVLAKAGVVMLLFGALHSHVPAVPALGFWVSLIIVALTHLLIPTTNVRTGK